jgi:hypothetical protein
MSGKQASKLLDHAGKRVTVICEGQEILRHFEGNKLLAQYGDEVMPHLLADLAKVVGCARPKTGNHNIAS